MSIGFWQIVLIFIVVLIIFGAGKLPKVMGDSGKGLRSFKEGMNEEEEEEVLPLPKTAAKKKKKAVKLPLKKLTAVKKKPARKTSIKKEPKKKINV